MNGQFLFAVDHQGRLSWADPAVRSCLEERGLLESVESSELSDAASREVRTLMQRVAPGLYAGICVRSGSGMFFLGSTGGGEGLFRLGAGPRLPDADRLAAAFDLTTREAEVLDWIAQGKSNRDIGDILGVSPRTINKHLEQVYVKLGVENRTAAAAAALRVLLSESLD